ncbi:hypothetical protein KA344_05765 [bacterium]|nr:hypothetical protein [bacterium]
MKKTTYGTFPIMWQQHCDEHYASVGNVRLRIVTELRTAADSNDPVYSASLALLTPNGGTVVKHMTHREEKMAIHLSENAADMLFGLPIGYSDPWVKLDSEPSLYARLDGRFLVEMKCFHYCDRSYGVCLSVFNEENKWHFAHRITAYTENEILDAELREARFLEATEKMKEFAAIMFLNRLTSPV